MFRSAALLRLARDRSCVSCGNNNGTIVAAHSNLLEHGKGRGLKAHDGMSAWLCYQCHSDYDQGTSMSRAEKEIFIKTMICRTYIRLWDEELIQVRKS